MRGGFSLRFKLSAAMLVLLAVALVAIGAASVSVLGDYLISRVDIRLAATARDAVIRLNAVRGVPQPGAVPPGLARFRVPPDGRIEIRDGTGAIVFAQIGIAVEGRPGPGRVTSAEPRTVRAVSGAGRWRAMAVPIAEDRVLVVAEDLTQVRMIIARLTRIELLCGGAVLVVFAVTGVVIVRRSLRPLAEIEAVAEAIAQGRFGTRVPEENPRTEVGRLARSLNGMLARIEAALRAQAASEAAARESEARMRRFVADASHELRTPLTSIRGFAEFYRRVPGSDPDRLMARIESEATRMSLLVEDLLLLARLDQQRPLSKRPVDMLAIAADAVGDAKTLCPDRDVSLEVEAEEALIVMGDEQRLRQVVGNLMNNAVTHTPQGTPITVRVGTAGGAVYFEVEDAGPGLTPEQAARVFERFYRADPSRARDNQGGSGLGLAIVESLVKAHGGTVSVRSEPGKGAAFRFTIPLASDPAEPAPVASHGGEPGA
ncbi:MAG: HAMP domain-containing sensor histidine kinase [Actinomycetales bacterium]|nr:two-component sensor histidine kinase [Actinomycetales bacterium]